MPPAAPCPQAGARSPGLVTGSGATERGLLPQRPCPTARGLTAGRVSVLAGLLATGGRSHVEKPPEPFFLPVLS